jgi:hypothetical protein
MPAYGGPFARDRWATKSHVRPVNVRPIVLNVRPVNVPYSTVTVSMTSPLRI